MAAAAAAVGALACSFSLLLSATGRRSCGRTFSTPYSTCRASRRGPPPWCASLASLLQLFTRLSISLCSVRYPPLFLHLPMTHHRRDASSAYCGTSWPGTRRLCLPRRCCSTRCNCSRRRRARPRLRGDDSSSRGLVVPLGDEGGSSSRLQPLNRAGEGDQTADSSAYQFVVVVIDIVNGATAATASYLGHCCRPPGCAERQKCFQLSSCRTSRHHFGTEGCLSAAWFEQRQPQHKHQAAQARRDNCSNASHLHISGHHSAQLLQQRRCLRPHRKTAVLSLRA